MSLLAIEEIDGASAACVKAAPGAIGLVPGDFAENLTTRGVVLHELPLGTLLFVGTAELEILQDREGVPRWWRDAISLMRFRLQATMPKSGRCQGGDSRGCGFPGIFVEA